MKLQLPKEFNNHGPALPILYNPDATVDKKTEDKPNSIKVEINTHQVEAKSELIFLYITVFKTGN